MDVPTDHNADGPLRVFLSHTSELREFPGDRSFIAAAEAAIARAGHAVTDMAYFVARDVEPAAYCVSKVAQANVYVGVVGKRYGAPVRGRPDVSYTELEFEAATSLGLPRLIFMVREEALPSLATEEPEDHATRQQRFRHRLLHDAGVTVAWVDSPAELELGLVHTLIEFRRQPEAPAAARRTLPRDVASFSDREKELDQLLTIALARVRSSHVVGISAIDGMAGVGKTAFAVHVAHQLASSFPDGQLFLDLHAHTAGQRPVSPSDALGSLLLTSGVAAEDIPPGADARAAMWRDRVAGRRMLIVLDDAAGREQVRPLLPASPGCMVLITSRRRLAALEDVESLTLDTLHPAEASALFVRLLGARGVDAEREIVSELVSLCGFLPLAIGLVAGRLRSHPAWTMRHLAGTLKDARDRLAEMQSEDIAVASAFELSYQSLDADHQRLFRRLGLHPGREMDAYAAAALDDNAVADTRHRLEALYHHHLLDEPRIGRFRMHDLIRQYARALAARDDVSRNNDLSERLIAYYVRGARTAIERFAPQDDTARQRAGGGEVEVAGLSSKQEAIDWLETERANLRACLDYATVHGLHGHAARLAAEMHRFMQIAYRDDLLMPHVSSDYPAVIESLRGALTLYRLTGDALGQANCLNHLGIVYHMAGDHQQATEHLLEASTIYAGQGDATGEQDALSSLGKVRLDVGDYTGALMYYQRAAALVDRVSDLSLEARILDGIAACLRHSGE